MCCRCVSSAALPPFKHASWCGAVIRARRLEPPWRAGIRRHLATPRRPHLRVVWQCQPCHQLCAHLAGLVGIPGPSPCSAQCTVEAVSAARCVLLCVCAPDMFYDGTCAAVGIVVIGNLLPRAFYRPAAGATDCLGAECFAPTFAVVAALSASACVCAVVLSCRSVELYRQMGGRELPQSKQLGSDGIGMSNADSDAAPPAPADNNGDSRVHVMTVSSVRLI